MSNNEDKQGQTTQGTTQSFSSSTVVIGTVNTGGGAFIGRDQVVYGVTGNELAALFAPLQAVIDQAPAEKQAAALQHAATLQNEVAKGKQADDTVIAATLEFLVEIVPSAVKTIVGLFSNPLLGDIAGGATKYVLKKLGNKAS